MHIKVLNRSLNLSSISLVIIIAGLVKFALHMYMAPGYGFFIDELYTMALSRHLAFGYVDLPPLVPALMALSRAVLGESLLAMHIVPALAGVGTLVFACLIAREFGGRTFAVAMTALGFIFIPFWLTFDSFFCYDSIDQLVLAGFLYVLVRFIKSGNRRLWLLLGGIAGIAAMTKMTILFLGPGFLAALLISRYRKDLLTPWPWLGAALCLAIVSPYLLWEAAHRWPTIEYWNNYGTLRVYKASLPQYLTNIIVYLNPLLLPFWLIGLYRLFRRLKGVNYGFLGVLFLITLTLLYFLHSSARLVGELFIPLIGAACVFLEELLSGAGWKRGLRALPVAYLLAAGPIVVPTALPVLPIQYIYRSPQFVKTWYQSIREFNAPLSYAPFALTGRLEWEDFVRDVAGVWAKLPAEERRVAGIYSSNYGTAGAIDLMGSRYGLPHAVSGALTYYLWGPGYSWDVMLVVTGKMNYLSVLFEECTQTVTAGKKYENPMLADVNISVCRHPKVSPDVFWSKLKDYH